MISAFQKNIEEHHLFEPGANLLLAVSGGIDSVVMAWLFHQLGVRATIAHCNFQLRADESEADEAFVRQLAQQLQFGFTSIRFDTKDYAHQKGISIQMAARDLRYNWFHELSKEFGYHVVAVAHNLDDVVETILMNLGRGTGIKGLTGIKPKNGIIVRPLLFASRKQIDEYAQKNNVSFRQDSSNSDTKYTRNAIRHRVVPVLKEIFPSFQHNVMHTAHCLSVVDQTYTRYIKKIKEQIFEYDGDRVAINIATLKSMEVYSYQLFDIFDEFGFHQNVLHDLLENIDNQSGAEYLSASHVLLKDRHRLFIRPRKSMYASETRINKEDSFIAGPIKLHVKTLTAFDPNDMPRKSNVVWLDADKLSFPLVLRPWHDGDFFHPLGMKGRKKISDYFTDIKLNRFDKSEVFLLTSGSDIVWVVGFRIDDRYKFTEQTKTVLALQFDE